MIDTNEMIRQLKEWSESDAGKASMEKWAKEIAFKEDLKDRNVDRIKKMFTDQESFDLLVLQSSPWRAPRMQMHQSESHTCQNHWMQLV